MKKRIALFAVVLAAAGILFLTFQSPAETQALAGKAQSVLAEMGIHMEIKPLRHYVHYVMYFALGLAVCALCAARGWRPWIGILIGCGIGVVDEGIKVLLPTREFDMMDLIWDFVGWLFWLE